MKALALPGIMPGANVWRYALLFAVIGNSIAASLFAQGTIDFKNTAIISASLRVVDAPVYAEDGGDAPSRHWVQGSPLCRHAGNTGRPIAADRFAGLLCNTNKWGGLFHWRHPCIK